MSLALTGLLLLQFYWIKNVHQLREEQFEHTIHQTIYEVISDIENIEKSLFYEEVDINNIGHLNLNNLIHYKHSSSIKDTTIKVNGKKENYEIVLGSSIDSTTGILTQHKVITKSIQSLFEFPENISIGGVDSNLYFSSKMKDSYNNNLMKKSQFLNEMMVKMFTTNLFDDITLRLNIKLLDTLINNRLHSHKIDTNYHFSIIDKKREVVKFSDAPEHYSYDLKQSEFIFPLFPSDLVSSNYQLVLDFPNKSSYVLKKMAGTLVASIFLILIVLFAFYFAVNTIYRQKQLSEIKNDFISNMTHELKTPISTISLACEAIEDPDIAKDTETMNSFISMISDENKRLGTLVEKVLQTSLLDKGKLKLQLQECDINEIVKKAVQNFQIQFHRKGGDIIIEHADEVKWRVDKVHFSNVIFNLLDNALKYSLDHPFVKINLKKSNNSFTLAVTDNGIGIKKEDLKRIFEKLYRVSTGNVHNVKGFGLGLDYVKSIVELHGGEISVKSEWEKGSTFKIILKNE